MCAGPDPEGGRVRREVVALWTGPPEVEGPFRGWEGETNARCRGKSEGEEGRGEKVRRGFRKDVCAIKTW